MAPYRCDKSFFAELISKNLCHGKRKEAINCFICKAERQCALLSFPGQVEDATVASLRRRTGVSEPVELTRFRVLGCCRCEASCHDFIRFA